MNPGTPSHNPLLGRAFADGHGGYNPNISRFNYHPRPASTGRSRSRSRARSQRQQQHASRSGSPDIPPNSEYETAPKDPLYEKRTKTLGIESHLRPASSDDLGSAGRSSSWLGWTPGKWWRGRRGLEELTRGEWRPVRPRFGGHWPFGEIESDWYERVYAHLYAKVGEFVGEYFGYGDLPVSVGGGERELVWLKTGFSEQFLWFVEKVAIQDNAAGGWDALLVERRYRECLVTGVLAKALEASVLDDLLFGADEVQKNMLKAQDECTLEFDGECPRTPR
jgi:hypothetical protein